MAWLAFFVARYGPTGHGALLGRIAFLAVIVAVALALASGVYEGTGVGRWVRAHLRRRRLDWGEFDEVRADWERRRSG